MRRYQDDDSGTGKTLLLVAGAAAGILAGAAVAQRLGGWNGVTRLVRRRRRLIMRLLSVAIPGGTIPALLRATGLLDRVLDDTRPGPARRSRRRRPSPDLDEIELDDDERAAAGLSDDPADRDYDSDEDEEDDDEESADVSPEILEARVLNAFRKHPVLRSRPIEIAADEEGWIELGGRVQHRREARIARHVARTVPGVRGVTGVLKLRVRRQNPPADTSARDTAANH